MKYVNLHIFFLMVHLCNIQMSAASARHRLKGMDYNIDDFLSQLFASRRFEELIDKLTEEAAYRIKYNDTKNSFIVSTDIYEVPVYNEKGKNNRSKGIKYDIDGFISQALASKNVHELLTKLTVNAASKIMRLNANSELRTRPENSYEYPPKTNQVNHAKMREELPENVDMQSIINQMITLSENLKRKYDNDDSDTNTKLQSKEEGSVNKDHFRKTVGSTSKYKLTETNKNHSKKKKIDQNKSLRADAKGHYRKADPNRYSESSHSGHSGTDGEDQENSQYSSLEAQSSSQELINSREAQNSELKVKGIVKQKTSHRDKSIREDENLSSLDEENHNPPSSKEKTNREVAETKAETENRSTDKIVVSLDHEDSVKNNKMVSDDNPYGEERSLEDQKSKEHSDEGQIEPIIRKEGGKLYTYVQDSDYKEYNEKMAEWRKIHPENPMDFLI